MQVLNRTRMIRHLQPVSACAIAAVAGMVAISLAACSSTAPAAPSHVPPRAVAGEPPVNWVQPLIGARRTTLAGAGAALGFVIPMPDVTSPIRTSSASASQISLTLSRVKIQPLSREAELVFDHGKVTILIGRATHKNAGAAFRTDLAAIKVGRAAIRRVNGQPAFVAWPRTDYTKSNPALVDFYLNGIDINVISTKLGTNMLLAIAGSIKAGKI